MAGGFDAEPGAYPWMTMMYIAGGSSASCNGALINSEWVITAEHCVFGGTHHVVLGAHEQSDYRFAPGEEEAEEPGGAKGYDVDFIVSRRDFPELPYADIGLVHLREPVTCASHIQALNLVRDPGLITNGKLVDIASWGPVEPGQRPAVLQRACADNPPEFNCPDERGLRLKISQPVGWCAQGLVGFRPLASENLDFMIGDSGSPFVINTTDGWGLVGVLEGSGAGGSSINRCIPHYAAWIDAVTQRGLPPTAIDNGEFENQGTGWQVSEGSIVNFLSQPVGDEFITVTYIGRQSARLGGAPGTHTLCQDIDVPADASVLRFVAWASGLGTTNVRFGSLDFPITPPGLERQVREYQIEELRGQSASLCFEAGTFETDTFLYIDSVYVGPSFAAHYQSSADATLLGTNDGCLSQTVHLPFVTR